MNTQQTHTLPEGWEWKRLEEIASINPTAGGKLTDEKEVTFLGMADVSDEGKILSPQKKHYKEVKSGFTRFTENDILVAKITPCFENGKGALVGELINETGFGSTEFHVIRPIADNRFIFYHTVSHEFRQKGKQQMSGSAGQQRVPSEFLRSYKLAAPPIPEQRQIAAVLSTWDRAIEQTNALLRQLRTRHRGLMQRLLTGKVRLSGFADEWRQVELGDVFKERCQIGYANLPLLSITAERGVIYRDELEKRDTSNEDKSKYKRICAGDIGYNTMRMWQGRSAVSAIEGIVSPAYTIVTPKHTIDVQFMGHLFKSPSMIHLFYRNSQGLVDDTLNCKFPEFAKVNVTLPPTIEEQLAIAAVLDTSLREIRQQEARLSSLREQKRGLMQNLLTGRVRVPLPAETA